jgi:hypothetical protein
MLALRHDHIQYLVLSAFISRPIYLLTTTKALCFSLYYVGYAFTQYIKITSINQKLVCTI